MQFMNCNANLITLTHGSVVAHAPNIDSIDDIAIQMIEGLLNAD